MVCYLETGPALLSVYHSEELNRQFYRSPFSVKLAANCSSNLKS